MNASWAQYLLDANLLAHGVLVGGAIWCIAFPTRRIYPMSKKNVWYYLMWSLFWLVFVSNVAFVVLDWNSGLWTSPLRFWLAIPVALSGLAFVSWGIATLGVKNTSALRDRFVAAGPYLISRNPQYVGDIFLFTGVAILANSQVVLVTHLLTSFVFLLAPLAEEPWLEGQYEDTYLQYRREVPRFL
jgi:protein-S-isoprenylcysteine O-methyltransferase Ste14